MKKTKGTYLLLVAVLGVAAILAGCSTDGNGAVNTGPDPVVLGTAGDFVILAQSAISTTGTPASAITGNVGLSEPGTLAGITGFTNMDPIVAAGTTSATADEVTGFIYAWDMDAPTPATLVAAASDMVDAYLDAEGRTNPDDTELGVLGDIGGLNIPPGLYQWAGAVTIGSDLTLTGSAADVWIFQIGGALTVAGDVFLSGALPQNVFWQVAAGATLQADSHFEGVILSGTAVTLADGASLDGRALAQSAVTLSSNIVRQP